MTMRRLNLRKDYPEWEWESTTKRRTAYDALINKKNTSLFAKSVWNEMVDCLNGALEEVGLSWNDTIASLSATKFNVWFIFDLIPQTFTARMFNSVRYNMEKLFGQTFIWEYDKDYEGYVGRSNYRGVNDASEPDTLYGSAILELARKINVVIEVLKDEALTVNGIGTLKGEFKSTVELATPEIKELKAPLLKSEFTMDGTVSEAVTKGFNARGSVSSSGSGRMSLKNAKSTFNAKANGITYYDAILTLEELYRNLYSTIFHYATTNAKLVINYHSLNVRVQIPNYMLEESRLTFADILEMLTRVSANESDDVELDYDEPIDVNVMETAKLVTDVLLANVPEKRLSTSIEGFGSISCVMEHFKGSTFISLVAHRETDKSRLNQGVSRRASSQVSCRTTVSIPQLIRCVVDPMIPEIIESVSTIDGYLIEPIAKYLRGGAESQIDGIHDLSKVPIERLNARTKAFDTDMNIELEALLIRILEINKRYQTTFNSELLCISKMLASGSATSKFSSDMRLELFTTSDSFIVRESFGPGYDVRLEALNYGDDYPVVDSCYEVLFDAKLDGIEPFPVRIDELFEMGSNSVMTAKEGNETATVEEEAFKHTIETSMSIVNLGFMSLDVKHDALLFADISFDPSSWLNPVQTEKDLEVYQVYGSELKNKNLHLE